MGEHELYTALSEGDDRRAHGNDMTWRLWRLDWVGWDTQLQMIRLASSCKFKGGTNPSASYAVRRFWGQDLHSPPQTFQLLVMASQTTFRHLTTPL